MARGSRESRGTFCSRSTSVRRIQLNCKGLERHSRPFASHIGWNAKFHIFGVFGHRNRTAREKVEGLRQSRMYQYRLLSLSSILMRGTGDTRISWYALQIVEKPQFSVIMLGGAFNYSKEDALGLSFYTYWPGASSQPGSSSPHRYLCQHAG